MHELLKDFLVIYLLSPVSMVDSNKIAHPYGISEDLHTYIVFSEKAALISHGSGALPRVVRNKLKNLSGSK